LRVEAEFAEVNYNRSEYSVYEYLRRTAVANPHAQITLIEPSKEIVVFPRSSQEVPPRPRDTKPHPLGVTTNDLIEMAHASKARKIASFLETEFVRVSSDKSNELQKMCPKIDFERSPSSLQWLEAEEVCRAMQKVKWVAPETESLVPIGEEQIMKSLKNILQPEQMKVIQRKPKVFRGGIPFQVEAAIAYGGKAGMEGNGDSKQAEIMRFANRVPLLFDSGNCAIVEAVKTIDWNRYELKNWENQPMSIFVNFVSVYVPYTGAGKLAISTEDEIVAEIRNALMDSARGIAEYLHGLQKLEDEEKRRTIFFKYIGEVSQALSEITGKAKAELEGKLREIAKIRTSLLEAAEEEALEEVGDVEENGKEEE
jgi:DNA topoisomerase-6 subunit B